MHCSILLLGCVFCVLFFAYAAASRVSWGTDLGGKFRKHTRPTHYDVVTSCDSVVGIDFTQQACVSVCVLMGEFGPTVVEAITKASFTGLSVYGTIF